MKTYKTECPELKVRLSREKIHKAKITDSKEAADFFRLVWDDSIDIYESFFVIYLNNANTTIGWYKASQGGITATLVDIRLVLKKAIDTLAVAMIVCHNHPSGKNFPSQQDKDLTEKLKNACATLDIKLLDHVILTEDNFFSFADENLI